MIVYAGQKIRASEQQAWMDSVTTIEVYKTIDESVTSSTTLQNDDDLFLPLEANKVYDLEGLLNFTGVVAADAKFAFTFPTGTSVYVGGLTIDTAGALIPWYQHNVASGTALTIGVAGATSHRPTTVHGTIVVGSTAGTFQSQWAQNVSDPTATVLRAGSKLRILEIP